MFLLAVFYSHLAKAVAAELLSTTALPDPSLSYRRPNRERPGID
jgi:hypothetical protein